MASTLGMSKIARLLNSNLKEELSAARKISLASVPILKQSALNRKSRKSLKPVRRNISAKKSKEDEAKAASDISK